MGEPRQLHVFTDGSDSVVAYNVQDARELWATTYARDPADSPSGDWEQRPDQALLTLTDDDLPAAEQPTTLTMREWCEQEGRGFLCSREV